MEIPSDIADLGELAAFMAATQGNISIKCLAESCQNFIKNSKSHHPVKLAATFGALLTNKKFQFNCLRLEALVHLSLANASGAKAPLSKILIQGFNEVGQALGYLEDPPEDIFVGNIYSTEGNYLVLNGLWESNTFYLQRFVNVVDKFPKENKSLHNIYHSVHALLKLSNLVCLKASLYKNELGSERSSNHLSSDIASNSFNLRNIVRFSSEELEQAGIDIKHLYDFVFDPRKKTDLFEQSVGHSLLELNPVAFDGDDIYLLLPTAVSAAIRRLVLKRFNTKPNRELLVRLFGHEYSELFNTNPFLGGNSGQVEFQYTPWGAVCGAVHEQDEGYYISMFFILDSLEDFDEYGLAGMDMSSDEAIKEVSQGYYKIQNDISNIPGFKQGLALFISCGIGRGRLFSVENKENRSWKEVYISAADISLLSNTPDMTPLNIWRVEDMKDRISELNVKIQNINGFLNLYAWAVSLDGHLVPHAEITEDHISIGGLNMIITQNQLVELRHEVSKFIDTHVQRYIDGNWLVVRKEGESHFDEDNIEPLYIHIPTQRNMKPIGAYLTEKRCWWFLVAGIEGKSDAATLERFKMMETWIARAANTLDNVFGSFLGNEPILWKCVFDYGQIQGSSSLKEYGTESDAKESIKTTVINKERTIELRISEGFDKALFNPENIAERELINALIKGIAELADHKNYDLNKVIKEVIPNNQARQSHAFQSRGFRDFIRGLHERRPIFINRFDDASSRLGMGWLARETSLGGIIKGKEECIQFMNLLVKKLEDQLCEHLRKYNKENLLNLVLLNFETASVERDRWHRTAAAVIGLRKDKAAVINAMNFYEHRLNGIFQPSRNLVEMIICESPNEGGLLASELELSQLMVQAAHLFHFGGWSDLIRWDLMEPHIVVRPLGDVHANHEFVDSVVIPFGNASSEYRYMSSVRNYENSLKEPTVISKADESTMGDFLKAWKTDFDVDLEAFRKFIDEIENIGIEKDTAILKLTQSELVQLASDYEIGIKIINELKLSPRSTWRTLPEGFSEKDIYPWRFRRRLSVLRRPLLQINKNEDPTFIVCPGLLREGFASTFIHYISGSYPDSHLKSAMRAYAGKIRNKTGSEFNTQVSRRMIELGWKTHCEIKLTKILKTSLDRDYGDIDVLAWCENSQRILIIECKDLQFKKTYGEIAEQLADFRGVTNEQGKNDLLKKHLDRVEILKAHIQALQNFLGVPGEYSVESHIVFKNPVPMQFANGPIKELAHCSIFENLNSI